MVTMQKKCFPCKTCSQQALFFYKGYSRKPRIKKSLQCHVKETTIISAKNLLQDRSS